MSPTTKLRRHMTRDRQIVICYRAGNTQEQIAKAFALSRNRVHQILHEQGCNHLDNPNNPRGERYAFIGANVTKDVKARFVAEAKRRGKSVSALTAELIEQELDR